MAGEKRKAVDESAVRKARIDQPEEFSKAVQRKLQTSTRTGQACDRCKIRKIKCDGLPGGCSPCLQTRTECRTTDRITGRATSRGYVEGLEQRNDDLKARVEELEQALAELRAGAGATASPPESKHTPSSQVACGPTPPWQSINGPPSRRESEATTGPVPIVRSAASGDHFLGVNLSTPGVSGIRGTSLSILGMDIDIADFVSPDTDEPDPATFHPALYNKSYQAFFQSVLNVNARLDKVELPPRTEGFTYAEWYFRALHPYLPILHRPTFLAVLTRMYDDTNYIATAADIVIVHTMIAHLKLQYAARNYEDRAQQEHLTKQSNLHYHYALSMFHLLLQSRTVYDVQAMTMLCMHLRSFPKPCASWILLQFTMALALELNMHRSEKQLALNLGPLQAEIRKRTFWALLCVHITIAGKLGRPMALRLVDFDIEMPDAIDDDALSSTGYDRARAGKCLHLNGIRSYDLALIYLEMYNEVYAVRKRPESHIATVHDLESKLQAWKDSLPTELMSSEHADQETKIFALYCKLFGLELRLLLRHPTVSTTSDLKFNNESMSVCLDAAHQMLQILRQLQKYKSLDTTWYNAAVHVMAITITLFSYWQRRERLTLAEVAALRVEMDQWLELMGEVGLLLGSGNRLREAIRVVVEGTLSSICQNPALRVETNAARSKAAMEGSQPSPRKIEPQGPTYGRTHVPEHQPTDQSNIATSSIRSPSHEHGDTWVHQPPSHVQQHNPLPLETPNSLAAITSSDSRYWRKARSMPSGPSYTTFSNAVPHTSMNPWAEPIHPTSTSQDWHQWTTAMSGHFGSQETYSAHTLLQMGDQYPIQPGSAQMVDETAAAWPLNIFDIGQGVS